MWSGRRTLNKPGLISASLPQRITQLAGPSLLLLALFALGQTPRPGEVTNPCAAAQLKQGLVVESVAKNSEGEKAGLTEGDIILSWFRGDAKGTIELPFDLSEVETEQEPRGRVTLVGARGGTRQAWIIGPDKWGIHARPRLTGSQLIVYKEGEELARAGKVSDAAERWRATAVESEKCQRSLLEVWLLFRAAEALADASGGRSPTLSMRT